MAHRDFNVVDLIIRYIEHLTSIRDPSHKRKPNLALRHIIAYVLKSKYNIKYPAPPDYLLAFFSNSSFHILHNSHHHPVHKEAMVEEERPIPAPIPIHHNSSMTRTWPGFAISLSHSTVSFSHNHLLLLINVPLIFSLDHKLTFKSAQDWIILYNRDRTMYRMIAMDDKYSVATYLNKINY
ncbi:hypothetical protein M5K25_002516 [Dendrobium thyrsiflorum]|uniref:Uncharacterized protein n=1 Tax=Dendrobium thyrsiflorum TaxID=117978 RepID=A0ABD0VMZ9_DENTH